MSNVLSEHSKLPIMYQARLSAGELIILEISPHCYMRSGTSGLSDTKLGAVEILKRSIMAQFQKDMNCIDWQAQQFVRVL